MAVQTPRTRLVPPIALALVGAVAFLVPPAAAWTCAISDFHYEVGGNTVTLANVHAGDAVSVVFTLNDGCSARQLSFASYNTTSNPSDLDAQTLFDSDTGTFGMGTHTLTVTVPPCYYQLDFVWGPVIEHFDTAHGVTYHGRQTYTEFPNDFIDGSTGGAACGTQTTTSSSTTNTTTQIPFFPSATALLVGVGGAALGTLFMLRRKL
jgi:hypothetical protein